MRIEYQDGRIHNVECYRLCKARLDNGEKIYFIEYKDFTDKQNGEYEDCYAIIENNNGIWQKVGKEIEYSALASKVVEELNPKILGEYLGFQNKNNARMFIPQTQTQPQREKIEPEYGQRDNEKPLVYENYIPQTQTQREKIDPEYSQRAMEEIFIPVEIDDSGIVIDSAFDIPTASYYKITGGMTKRGLSYNSTTGKEINRSYGTFATFDFVSFPYDFGKIFDEQNERIMSNSGKIAFKDLEDIIYENKVYRFIPTKFLLSANEGFNTQLDIKLSDNDEHLTPGDILERFGDYRLKEGYINDGYLIQKVPGRKIDNQVNDTVKREQNNTNNNLSQESTNSLAYKNELKDIRKRLTESKNEIERLRNENAQLKNLLAMYQNKEKTSDNQPIVGK